MLCCPQVFNDVTEEICAEKNVSLSKEIVFVKALHNPINKVSSDTSLSAVTKSLVKTLKDQITERFKHIDSIEDNELITQCTLLDPRIKKLGFSTPKKMEACCKDEEALTTNLNTAAVSLAYSSLLWGNFDEKFNTFQSVSNPTAAGIIEFETYILETKKSGVSASI
ncbi:unnamed protein product [Brassicogethes aeneus]|uniref:Uncharacterized protein n=1 Tax=Brassicogethes aeneus TaxID=1431903 RepID=A0A9P0BFG4_BRAAE|nr:unnamed protein product [Brassicogethes aeneus]